MATGDITAVEILSSGWEIEVEIEGFTSGMIVDLGSGDDVELDYDDIGSASIVVSVVSEGYDNTGSLGTVARTLYAHKVMRKAYPDNADAYETSTAGGYKIRMALNEFVYNDDQDGGAGTSGTDPTVTIAAGTFTNDGGSSETSAAASGASVTNSSTLDYPKCIGMWRTIPDQRITDDFTLEFEAYNRLGVACCILSCEGDTSSHTDSTTATAMSARQRSGSGLYGSAYTSATFRLSDYTQGEGIDCRARVYPVVGDADSVLDTDDYATGGGSAEGPENMRRSFTHTCDKTEALTSYAVVEQADGNDGTGVVSTTLATAEASTYATIHAAIADGATLVYVRDNGTSNYDAVSASITRVTTDYWIVVEPHPDDTASNITIVIDANTAYDVERLCYRGLRITRGPSGNCWMDGGNEDLLWLDGCTWIDDGRGLITVGLFYRSVMVYLTDCTDLLILDIDCNPFSSTRCRGYFDGCTLIGEDDNACEITACQGMTACSVSGKLYLQCKNDPGGDDPDQVLYSFCECLASDNSGDPGIFIGETDFQILDGVAVVNVLLEQDSTSAALLVAADSSAVDQNNVILWHNTIVGQRANLGYNDVGTTAYDRLNWSVKFNTFDDFNTKHDTFGTASGNRIGGWPVSYAVGFLSNNYELSNFPGDAIGFDVAVNASPGFVDDQSDGTYNGDYTPDTGSILLDRVPSGEAVIPFDMYGNAIGDDGTGDIGAIQAAGGVSLLYGMSAIEWGTPGEQLHRIESGAV